MDHGEIASFADTVADIGSAYYFRPATVAVGKEHGLDRFRFYFLGRAGALGDVDASVALAALGYFEPTLFARMWESATATLPPRAGARLHAGCNHDLGRSCLAEVGGLEAFCDAAAAVNDAIDPTSCPLYASLAAEPVPDDPPARALHLAMLLREGRASIHLLALVASGLSTRMAHQIRRPNDGELFGWSQPVEPTDAHRASWQTAEDLTNTLIAPAFSVLDDTSARALVDGANAIHAALIQ